MLKPVFLIAGGRQSDPYSFRRLIQAVFAECGKDKPVIGYSGTANGDDAGFFQHMAGEFIKCGAGKVIHAVISAPGADIETALDILRSADLVFMSGGDVDGGMSVLEEKGLVPFFTDLYQQGKPFFGVSAGSIMLAERWVRWPDPENTDSAELFDCLGAAGVICDCHDEESGWEELNAELELESEGTIGYGLVAGSGIRVAKDSEPQAIGRPVHRFIKRRSGIERIKDLMPVISPEKQFIPK